MPLHLSVKGGKFLPAGKSLDEYLHTLSYIKKPLCSKKQAFTALADICYTSENKPEV